MNNKTDLKFIPFFKREGNKFSSKNFEDAKKEYQEKTKISVQIKKTYQK